MTDSSTKIERDARLRWVPIADMKVNPQAQRDLNRARIEHLATDFDLEQIGVPTVNQRDGSFYIIDGQHRVEALKLMGWGDQQIQCWVYDNLTSEQEADVFLRLNDNLAVNAMPKFKTAVHAGRRDACDIDRIVRANGAIIDYHENGDRPHIAAVGTVERIYHRAGGEALGRTIRIARNAFGQAGMEASMLGGIALVCQRYNGELDDEWAIERLTATAGGASGLMNNAAKLRERFGGTKATAVAAAAVDQINRGKRGKKLPSWWKAAP